MTLRYLRHDDPELVERLLPEARVQAQIDHPGLCQVYEVGEDEGRPFIAMQYVDGELLNAIGEAFANSHQVQRKRSRQRAGPGRRRCSRTRR